MPEPVAHPELPIVVVGAGAAGLMASISAARGGRPVLLLERTRDGGRKILISGGGRCNILPSHSEPSRFVSDSSPHTLRKILSAWPLEAQKQFFEEEVGLRLALEAETGKLFPVSNSARQVRDGLVTLARRRGVTIHTGASVTDLIPGERRTWTVMRDAGEPIVAAAVILASGGLSVPATGSDGTGLEIARRLGHTIHDTYPALTPLLADRAPHAHLAGVSLDVTLEAPLGTRKVTARGGFLFTHRGYSGPAILDISHLAVLSKRKRGPLQPIFVRWTDRGAEEWERTLRGGSGLVLTTLREHLPARVAEMLLVEGRVAAHRTHATLPREERLRLVTALTRYPLPWTGEEGYKKAEVTGGGIALEEIVTRTLESRIHPGLFLCGEILDAFGPIGGHNFQWAWATGRAAGLGAAEATVSR